MHLPYGSFPYTAIDAVRAEILMIDIQTTKQRLQDHVKMLTITIGERSVLLPGNLEKTRAYIEKFYQDIGVPVHCEPYPYRNFTVSNVVAQISFCENPTKYYLVGAHYDSVAGTVGADDNASAVAVQLETARHLMMLKDHHELNLGSKVCLVPSRRTANVRYPAYGEQRIRPQCLEIKGTDRRHDLSGDGRLYLS